MHHIIYMSRAATELKPTDLAALLVQSRRNNEQAGITGALVYGDGQFMQVLEGDEAAVMDCYQRIAQDPRHDAVFKLADKAIEERYFVNWSMAFHELPPDQFTDLTGYVSPAQWEQAVFTSASADTLLLERMRAIVLLTAKG